jgi:LDH2 family malate/lactate/ureidoglycolate dehydrogenase
MNVVPDNAVRVSSDKIKRFVSQVAEKAGMRQENADFLASRLVENDLRGVFSHGSVQIATYARLMREGKINPNPDVRTVKESPSTLLVDGDGGLGYFAAWRAAESLAERCRAQGIVAAVTRNHGHIGAAGIYSRLLVKHNLIAYVTSGHQLTWKPDQSIMRAAGGSPMSFAVPSGGGPAMVLDFGTMHDLYQSSPHVDELVGKVPGIVLRSMGLGFMCQALGGFLAGVKVDEDAVQRPFPGAYQGALIIAIDVEKFLPLADFLGEMDEFGLRTAEMNPLPGFDRATLPGALEDERERDWIVEGIPVSERHRDILTKIAVELGVEESLID